MANINEEIETLLHGVTDMKTKQELLKNFFVEKSKKYAAKVRKLSFEELDNIVGGLAPIGDTEGTEGCEEYKSGCVSLGIGVDVCNTFVC